MTIIASLALDSPSDVDCGNFVYLAAVPFPGDLVLTKRGETVRVIRRTFMDHGRFRHDEEVVDVELTVRKEHEWPGDQSC